MIPEQDDEDEKANESDYSTLSYDESDLEEKQIVQIKSANFSVAVSRATGKKLFVPSKGKKGR